MRPELYRNANVAFQQIQNQHIEKMKALLDKLSVRLYAEILGFHPTKVTPEFIRYDVSIPFHQGPVFIRNCDNFFHIGTGTYTLTHFAEIYFDVSPLVLVSDPARFKLGELARRSEKAAKAFE